MMNMPDQISIAIETVTRGQKGLTYQEALPLIVDYKDKRTQLEFYTAETKRLQKENQDQRVDIEQLENIAAVYKVGIPKYKAQIKSLEEALAKEILSEIPNDAASVNKESTVESTLADLRKLLADGDSLKAENESLRSANERLELENYRLHEEQEKECAASKLIDVWVAKRGPIPWAKAVEIVAIVQGVSDSERDRLLHLEDEPFLG